MGATCCHHDHCSAPKPGGADPRWRRALWIALGVNAAMSLLEIAAGAAAATASAFRCASAMTVIIGLVPEAVGNALVSPIHTPPTSCSSPQGPATLEPGSVPMRQVPI